MPLRTWPNGKAGSRHEETVHYGKLLEDFRGTTHESLGFAHNGRPETRGSIQLPAADSRVMVLPMIYCLPIDCLTSKEFQAEFERLRVLRSARLPG